MHTRMNNDVDFFKDFKNSVTFNIQLIIALFCMHRIKLLSAKKPLLKDTNKKQKRH